MFEPAQILNGKFLNFHQLFSKLRWQKTYIQTFFSQEHIQYTNPYAYRKPACDTAENQVGKFFFLRIENLLSQFKK